MTEATEPQTPAAARRWPEILLATIAMVLLVAVALLAPEIRNAILGSEETAGDERIREYIVANPDVIIESLQIYDYEQRLERDRVAVSMNRAAVYENAASPVGGNPDGDVTLVEFFDYRCGFCKSAFPDLLRLIEEDGNIRLVYKEYPILGPDSLIASRAALASVRQSRYVDFHNALMAHQGDFSHESIMAIAIQVGLDADQLTLDMESPEIAQLIQDNLALAQNLNVGGTPTFVVNDEVIMGAVGIDVLRESIARARDRQG